MKKRIVAMVLAGTMVFSQNVYATELPSGIEHVETEQQEETQQNTKQYEAETSDEVKQNEYEQKVESTASDETLEGSRYTAEDIQKADSDTYWEDIQQYASDEDDTGVFDEELYKANQNLKKRTLYVGNPILVSSEQVYENVGDYHINASDDSICKVSIEPSENEYDYRYIKLDPMKSGKIFFNITDANGKEVYNCEVTVLDNPPADAAPIKDIEIRSWLFARTYYGADGYISQDELSHIQYMSFYYGCRKENVTDLSGLEYATGLKYLNLSRTNVKDVTSITKLKNLGGLCISGMELDDYSWLSNFANIKRLDISNTRIKDFSFLSKMTELEDIDVSDTDFNDLTLLSGAAKLEELVAGGTLISDLGPLSKLENLEYIYIVGCYNITSISPLLKLSNLRQLKMSSKQISDKEKLEMARKSIEKDSYSKGDLIEIPAFSSLLFYEEKIHVDITGGDINSVEIQNNDSDCVKLLAKDKGTVDLSISLGTEKLDTIITIKGDSAEQQTGPNNDKEIKANNVVEGISNTILTNNGDLWRIYPETKKLRSNVKKYVGKWIYTIDQDASEVVEYSLDNNNDLWSGDKKIQSNIKDVDGHYAITNDNTLINLYNNLDTDVANVKGWYEDDDTTIMCKDDGTLWFRKEVSKGHKPDEWKKIADDVIQYNKSQYVTKSGEWNYVYVSENGDFSCDEVATGVAKVDFNNRFYYGLDGNCYLCTSNAVNIGKVKVKKWNRNYYENCYYIITEDNKLYSLDCENVNDKVFVSDNIGNIGEASVYDANKGNHVYKSWFQDLDGNYYFIEDGKLIKTAHFDENGDGTFSRNGVTILTNVKDSWIMRLDYPNLPIYYALRTDGTIWDVTGVPKQILDIGQSTVEPGDVDGDSKVSTKDLMIVLYGVSGRNALTDEQALAADIDGDGKVTVSDLTKILYYVSGRNTTL